MNKIVDVLPGDLFSSIEYLQVTKLNKDTVDLKHLTTGEIVTLSNDYVEKLMNSADQYGQEVVVGLEDKKWTAKQIADQKRSDVKEGDVRVPGIKTIWNSIGSKAFRVCFVKKGTTLSAKQYKALVDGKLAEVDAKLTIAKTSKKGVTAVALELMRELIDNPITNTVPGEQRELRGWKLSHESSDGKYDVMDADIMEKRVVTLPSILWIVVNGVKYIVE